MRTNGRVERLFRTFKKVKRLFCPFFATRRRLESFCADFVEYFNHCRPHQANWGLTPDEVFRGEASHRTPALVSLFDGQLIAHRFGPRIRRAPASS